MDLDHVFIAVRDPAGDRLDVDDCRHRARRWAEALRSAGFVEGSNRRHPGQGTANRRFFFERFTLELLLLDDVAELRQPRGKRLSLEDRFINPDASPFGFGFRPDARGNRPEFESVAYFPAYLPDGMHIDVAADAGTADPLLFHLPFPPPFENEPPDDEPREHRNGATSVLTGTVSGSGTSSDAARSILAPFGFRLTDVTNARLVLEFDVRHRRQGSDASRSIATTTQPPDAGAQRLPEDCPLEIGLRPAGGAR